MYVLLNYFKKNKQDEVEFYHFLILKKYRVILPQDPELIICFIGNVREESHPTIMSSVYPAREGKILT